MLKFLPVIASFILFLSCLIFAQSQNLPKQIDEFGSVNSEDLTARMEWFSNELRQNQAAKGYIIISRAKDSPFGFPIRFKTIMQNFLVEKLQLPLNRFEIVSTEPSDIGKTQVWIVPDGSKPPVNDLTDEKFHLDATKIFDSFLYPTKFYEMSCCSIDGYTKSAKNASLDKFAAELEKLPSSKGYIIFYGQYCTDCGFGARYSRRGKYLGVKPDLYFDSLKTVSRILRKERNYPLKHYKLNSSNIISINGGYRKWQGIELWVIPSEGEIPKLNPTYFPKNRKVSKLKS